MKLTSDLFEAFLKCPTKCYFRSIGQAGTGNAYADWVRKQNDAYRREAVQTLMATLPEGERAITAPNLKSATWRLAMDLDVETEILVSRLHAVERVPPQGRGRPAQFIPIRFTFFNKLTKDDRLLVAFDALVLGEALGREISMGKIIHGDDHAKLKVKVASLLGTVRKLTWKMATLLAGGSAPDLILNRHCGECEFRDRCRQKALEKEDLSLLGGMAGKERKKYHSKGIFTVTQLSYTFRPRRRSRRLRDKPERYHHSLKALAIREKKIHIVGSPELKIEGTPVYLDIEGLPDRDFYYLIGLRTGNGESVVQHSLWADTVADEGKIWLELLNILEGIERPVIIHYGSYETHFLKQMRRRHRAPCDGSAAAKAIASSLNLLTVIFAHIYFPTFSNGLKEIANWLGFTWNQTGVSGLHAIHQRHLWETSRAHAARERLITYNSDDCRALEVVTSAVQRLGVPHLPDDASGQQSTVVVESLKSQDTIWTKFKSPIPEFEQVNKAARWAYQRDRIYIRSSRHIKRIAKHRELARTHLVPINKKVVCPDESVCPDCGSRGIKPLRPTTRVLHDLLFGKASLKRWVVQYEFYWHWCPQCKRRFGEPKNCWRETKYGRNLVAYVLYKLIEIHTPQMVLQRELKRLWGYDFNVGLIAEFKAHAAEFYADTVKRIFDRLRCGQLVHVDETKANVRGRTAYVWIFTNLHEVVYLYSHSREADLLRATLTSFCGVLVSDFYSAYDAIPCPQQKCLLHLLRDFNSDLLGHPYDDELKQMAKGFAEILQPIIATIDRHGLKSHFLRPHVRAVSRFFKRTAQTSVNSEPASKWQKRFEKYGQSLFTFLEHDGVPWNNNNAEHAVKAFAALRDVMRGSSTQKGIEDYLVLLSVNQTCIFSGIDFLDFLRSGEKDIYAFAVRQRRQRGRARDVLRDADGIFRDHHARRRNQSPK